MVVASYGRNKNRDDEMKKTKRRPIIAPAIAVRVSKIPSSSKQAMLILRLSDMTKRNNKRKINLSFLKEVPKRITN